MAVIDVDELAVTVADAPPIVTVGVDVAAGVATVAFKFVPTIVTVSVALPAEPEPNVVFVTEVIVGAAPYGLLVKVALPLVSPVINHTLVVPVAVPGALFCTKRLPEPDAPPSLDNRFALPTIKLDQLA